MKKNRENFSTSAVTRILVNKILSEIEQPSFKLLTEKYELIYRLDRRSPGPNNFVQEFRVSQPFYISFHLEINYTILKFPRTRTHLIGTDLPLLTFYFVNMEAPD